MYFTLISSIWFQKEKLNKSLLKVKFLQLNILLSKIWVHSEIILDFRVAQISEKLQVSEC